MIFNVAFVIYNTLGETIRRLKDGFNEHIHTEASFFLFFPGLEHSVIVSPAQVLRSRSELSQFFFIPAKLVPFDDRPDD